MTEQIIAVCAMCGLAAVVSVVALAVALVIMAKRWPRADGALIQDQVRFIDAQIANGINAWERGYITGDKGDYRVTSTKTRQGATAGEESDESVSVGQF